MTVKDLINPLLVFIHQFFLVYSLTLSLVWHHVARCLGRLGDSPLVPPPVFTHYHTIERYKLALPSRFGLEIIQRFWAWQKGRQWESKLQRITFLAPLDCKLCIGIAFNQLWTARVEWHNNQSVIPSSYSRSWILLFVGNKKGIDTSHWYLNTLSRWKVGKNIHFHSFFPTKNPEMWYFRIFVVQFLISIIRQRPAFFHPFPEKKTLDSDLWVNERTSVVGKLRPSGCTCCPNIRWVGVFSL